MTTRHLSRILFCFTELILAMELTSCSISHTQGTITHYRLDILRQNWSDPNPIFLGYTQETAWPWMKTLDLTANSIITITENDISIYDWGKQEIILTEETTSRIRTEFTNEDFFRWITLKQLFIVTIDNEWKYGGVINEEPSPAAIRFPVIYLNYSNQDQFTLIMRASHLCIIDKDCIKDIQNPEIYSLFIEQGKIIE